MGWDELLGCMPPGKPTWEMWPAVAGIPDLKLTETKGQWAEVVTKTDSAQFLAPRDVQEATITNSYAGFVSRFSGKPLDPRLPKACRILLR